MAKRDNLNGESIVLYRQAIPRERFEALSEEDRYCLLLLGHVHDELSWLQRMAYVASRANLGRKEVEKSGNMMQATFLARLMLGKLFEFKKVMSVEGSAIPGFIASFFAENDVSVGAARVSEISEYYRTEKWIRIARNKHFLHYPDFEDVRATINDPQIEWHVEVYNGQQSSNTFHPTSDVMANYAWFRLANANDPMRGFGEALDTIIELSRLTLDTLERTIAHFVDQKLVSHHEAEKVTLRGVIHVHDVRFDYFVRTGATSRKKARKG